MSYYFTGTIPLARGGTNADLSATGGTSKFLKQASVGAAITVVQPNIGDIAGGSRPMADTYADTYFFYESTTSEAVAYWQGDGQCQLGRTSQAHFYVPSGTGDTYLYNPTGRYSRFYYNNVEKYRFAADLAEMDRLSLGGTIGSSTDPGAGGLALIGKFYISTTQTPASAGATGTTGQICWDSSYIYVCTAPNTWKRAAIATW